MNQVLGTVIVLEWLAIILGVTVFLALFGRPSRSQDKQMACISCSLRSWRWRSRLVCCWPVCR